MEEVPNASLSFKENDDKIVLMEGEHFVGAVLHFDVARYNSAATGSSEPI